MLTPRMKEYQENKGKSFVFAFAFPLTEQMGNLGKKIYTYLKKSQKINDDLTTKN